MLKQIRQVRFKLIHGSVYGLNVEGELQTVFVCRFQIAVYGLVGKAAFSPPAHDHHPDACLPDLFHMCVDGTGIIGTVTAQPGIKIGSDILPARIASGIVPGTVYPVRNNRVIPVLVSTVEFGIPEPGIVEGMYLVIDRMGEFGKFIARGKYNTPGKDQWQNNSLVHWREILSCLLLFFHDVIFQKFM
jgi:hypothetical protein